MLVVESNSLTFLENIRKCIFQRKKGVGKESPNLFLLCLFGIFALFTGLNQKADTCKYFFLDKKVKPTFGQYFQNCIFQCKKRIGKKVKPFFPLHLYLFALFAVFNHEADTCKYIFLNKTVKSNLGKILKIGQKSEKIAFF